MTSERAITCAVIPGLAKREAPARPASGNLEIPGSILRVALE